MTGGDVKPSHDQSTGTLQGPSYNVNKYFLLFLAAGSQGADSFQTGKYDDEMW
jgi:hypothetical protein